jgi:cell division protein FtsB
MRRGLAAALLYFVSSLVLPPASAQELSDAQPSEAGAEVQATSEQIDELRRRLDVLAAEVERLRSGEPEEGTEAALTEEQRRALGLAPSAARAYRRSTSGISFAGYGEMLAENFATENESGAGGAPTTRIDFLRAVLYTGYRFNDRFLFNSEIEVEHGNEIFVEFAYVDFRAHGNLTLRGGLVLIPLGLVNEFHEPNVFLGARRPETETRIIPSTWRENGGGVLGSVGPVNYRAFVTNGFNGAGFTSAGLRGGRQRGIQARAANLAFSGRVDVAPIPGVFAGVGLYTGGSGQEQVVLNGEQLDLDTTVAEVHGQAQIRGFDVRGLYARATLDDAGAASLALRLPLTAPLAETMVGGYLQVGYNVLSQFGADTAVTPYFRVEHVDTQDEIPDGFVKDLTRDGDFRTFGVDIKPIPNVVIKTEYQWLTNAAGTGRNQFNLNLGYAF